MTARITELYQMIQDGQASSLSCVVVHSGEKGATTFSGFLTEDINISNSSQFTNDSEGLFDDTKYGKLLSSGMDMINKGVSTMDGSAVMFNPMSTALKFKSFDSHSFSVSLNLFTLDEHSDIISKAKEALYLTAPRMNGPLIEAPGGYSFPSLNAISSGTSRSESEHAKNTWSLSMGNHFKAYWLVCTNLSVTISKEHVKVGRSTQPLYITLKFDFTVDRARWNEEVASWLDGGTIDVSIGKGTGSRASQIFTNPIRTIAGGISGAVNSVANIGAGIIGEVTETAINTANDIANIGDTISKPWEKSDIAGDVSREINADTRISKEKTLNTKSEYEIAKERAWGTGVGG